MIVRGSIVLVALSGDYGKPRPALIVQADLNRDLITRIVCPITSDVHEDQMPIRPIVEPTSRNGLRMRSQVMTDKPHVVSIQKLNEPIGHLEPRYMSEVGNCLLQLLGLS